MKDDEEKVNAFIDRICLVLATAEPDPRRPLTQDEIEFIEERVGKKTMKKGLADPDPDDEPEEDV